jgi:EAL domain-containing protein (putative c-di-GMP-specific phosphodiesterase class I)/CheY-like chemotaxis protein
MARENSAVKRDSASRSASPMGEASPAGADYRRLVRMLAQTEALCRCGSIDIDLGSGRVTLSAGMWEVLGVVPPAAKAQSRRAALQWLPGEERQDVASIWASAVPGEPFEFQHRVVRADGNHRVVLHRGMVEAGADGRPLRGVAILQDITAQREAERRIQELANDDDAFTPQSNKRAARRLAIESGLRHALARGELALHYQPQVDLHSGAMIGVEALLRWNSASLGDVPPDEFIPLAEQTGLIVPIGEWVLREACAQSAAWQRAGHGDLRVAFNLSARQLEQPDLAQRVQAILLDTQADPARLGVEVTESMLAADIAHAARTLSELRAMGVKIALDDFGTGYSNLNYLRSLPIDVIKVDRSFVHDVTAAPADVSVTRAVITMAHSLQMKVLAEGVETEGQLALLAAHGCDQIQGFFFSRPVAAAEIDGMLREGRRLPERFINRPDRRRTLLIVDDEENIVAALKRLLRRDGYHIVTAYGAAEGLQRLTETDVDVIVSDQRMPGMTGVEFLRRAKQLYPDTVRMVLSGYTELQSITDAINEGAIYKFLTKPWDDARLRAHIEEAFRQKEMADENRRLNREVQQANQELADVNQRLQRLLASQREQMSLEEGRAANAREVLENVPAPIIGFDVEGLIAFVNRDAQALLPQAGALLGRDADEALPPELRAVWRCDDGVHRSVALAGRRYRAVCRSMNGSAHARGKLLVMTPEEAAEPPL